MAAGQRFIARFLATGKTRLAKPFLPYAPVFA
jgi:hypothetical protein